eukprot:gene2183-1351_t
MQSFLSIFHPDSVPYIDVHVPPHPFPTPRKDPPASEVAGEMKPVAGPSSEALTAADTNTRDRAAATAVLYDACQAERVVDPNVVERCVMQGADICAAAPARRGASRAPGYPPTASSPRACREVKERGKEPHSASPGSSKEDRGRLTTDPCRTSPRDTTTRFVDVEDGDREVVRPPLPGDLQRAHADWVLRRYAATHAAPRPPLPALLDSDELLVQRQERQAILQCIVDRIEFGEGKKMDVVDWTCRRHTQLDGCRADPADDDRPTAAATAATAVAAEITTDAVGRTAAEAQGKCFAPLSPHSSGKAIQGAPSVTRNYLFYVARCGLLYLLWPVLQTVAYFQALPRPIALPDGVLAEDWNRMGAEAQACFAPGSIQQETNSPKYIAIHTPVAAFAFSSYITPIVLQLPDTDRQTGAAMADVTTLPQPMATAGAAQEPANTSAPEVDANLPGMRREWNFTLTFVHEAARVQLLCPPHWEPGFIEPERIEELSRLDRDVKHCPMTPALRFMDFSSKNKDQNNPPNANASGAGAGTSSHPGGTASSANITMNTSRPMGNNGVSDQLPRDLSMQRGTQVELLYSHIPPSVTLSAYCISSVQHVLKNPNVICVDGQQRLSRLRIGKKLWCPHRLGGHRSFHFYYSVQQKTELVTHDVVYCIGTIIGQRGYLVTVRCADDEELESYLHYMFLPYFCNPTNLRLDANVSYSEVPSTHLLSERSQRYGELRYEDRDAAVSFSLPMHPLRVRPDFSPTKTVGVGSIACMTLELNVYESLIDDATVAEITGMPKYKINQVLLCVEVEDVARMNYPGVMTTDDYSELKTRRLLEVLQGAKVVGTPTSLHLGPRIGRSHTITFEYEPFSGPTKAMYVCTLVGNFGVTAYYLTKLGGGYFETHLYIYKQLLGRLQYQQQHMANITFSRFDVANVRLLETELYRAYTAAPVDQRHVYQEHVHALAESNDGNTDGAEEVPVPEEDGGYVRRSTVGAGGAAAAAAAAAGGPRASISQNTIVIADVPDGPKYVLGLGSSDRRLEVPPPPPAGGFYLPLAGGGEEEEDRVSSHSQSVISVTSIPHLQGISESDEDTVVCGEGQQQADGKESAMGGAAGGGVFSSNGASSGGGLGGNGNASSTGGEYVEGLLSADDDPHHNAESISAGPPPMRGGSRRTSLMAPPGGEAMGAGGRRASGYANAMLPSASMHSAHTAEAPGAPSAVTAAGAGVLLTSPSGVMGGYPQGSDFGENVDDAFRLGSRDRGDEGGLEGTGGLPPPSQLTREMLTGPAAMRVLDEDGQHNKAAEPTLRDIYLRCCEDYQCKANSYLLQRLPADPRFSDLVEELDVSSNYVGHTGFMAILGFLEHLPNIQHVHFNGMSLDNTDVENLCDVLQHHPTLTSIHLRNNPRITLPSTKLFFRLLRQNQKITTLSLQGTRIGDSVIKKLETLASDHSRFASQEGESCPGGESGMNEMDLSEPGELSPNGNASQTESVDNAAVKDVDEVKPEE